MTKTYCPLDKRSLIGVCSLLSARLLFATLLFAPDLNRTSFTQYNLQHLPSSRALQSIVRLLDANRYLCRRPLACNHQQRLDGSCNESLGTFNSVTDSTTKQCLLPAPPLHPRQVLWTSLLSTAPLVPSFLWFLPPEAFFV